MTHNRRNCWRNFTAMLAYIGALASTEHIDSVRVRSMIGQSAAPEYRRALAYLAASPLGVAKAALVAEGFSAELIAELARAAYVECVAVNGRAMPIDLIRIMEAGWQLLMS